MLIYKIIVYINIIMDNNLITMMVKMVIVPEIEYKKMINENIELKDTILKLYGEK
jgi:hypothetical protein